MTKAYTIALVTSFPPSQQTLNEYGYHLVRHFAEDARVKKIVVVADKLATQIDELDLGSKVEVRRVWRFNAWSNPWKIVRTLSKLNPDLTVYNVHVGSFGDKEISSALGLFAPMASRLSRNKTGIIAHNMISGIQLDDTILKGQRARQRVVKLGAAVVDWAMMHANYITFTLESYTEYYKSKYPKASIYYVPHGTFDTSERTLKPYDLRDNVIVTMGKFGTYKKLETLISAVKLLRKMEKYTNVKLIIGGTDHPNTPGYMKSIEEANKSENWIEFRGYIAEEDIPEFFGQARLSVFDYSSTTGSSGVLHQTASYGAVPIFPAIGDFVDICKNEGLSGQNYEADNASDMAAAIKAIIDNPARAKAIGEANRLAAQEMPMSEIVDFHINRI